MRKSTRLICLSLVLALLLSLAACVSGPATTAPSQNLGNPTTTQNQPSSTVTIPTTILPTHTTQPTEPVDPNALVYTLTQEDIDAYYKQLADSEALAIAGEDMDAIEASTDKLDDQYEYIGMQYSIAQILYYSNMRDEALTQQHLDCSELYTDANDAYIQMARRVYQSDSPAKDMLFEGWTQEELDQLMAYDPRVNELQQRNKEIEVAYQATTMDDERIPLYIELVQNNNEIARIYGYDNYYTYASKLAYERDYTTKELKQMQDYAKEYLAPSLQNAFDRFYNSFYSLAADKQNVVTSLLYDSYKTAGRTYLKQFLSVMPESFQGHYEQMLEADSLFTEDPYAMAGAFTTAIGDRSYCFFGPGYNNSFTLIHEGGHYYASRYNDLHSIPLDLAEVHSQANEWLFMRCIRKNNPGSHYQALVNYRLYNDLATILICLMVDEFEQTVYSTDLTGFTADDFDAIMDDICTQYVPLDAAKEYLTDVNAYWRMVVVDQPVYYISYAVSAVASIDLYTVSLENFDNAVEIYRKLCEEPIEDAGFLANIKAAGLAGPFEEEFYITFSKMINKFK